MAIGVSGEWGQFHEWFAVRLEVLWEASGEIDPSVMERVREAFSVLFEKDRAAEAVADLESLVRQRSGTGYVGALRTCLAYALAARTVVERSVTRDGALVVLERAQLTTCLRCAEQIRELKTGDVEVERFAADLLDRLRAGETWAWSRELSIAPAVLVFGVLPVVVGALAHLVPLVVFGVLAGTTAVYALVLVNRKQRWQVEAQALRPLVGR